MFPGERTLNGKGFNGFSMREKVSRVLVRNPVFATDGTTNEGLV